MEAEETKLEYTIVASVAFLIAVTVILILAGPQSSPSLDHIEQINRQALVAKDAGDEKLLQKYRSEMQQRLVPVASDSLGASLYKVTIPEFSFPFVDVSEIKTRPNVPENAPICEFVPKIPDNLEKIKNTELFLLFHSKYHPYQLELIVQDERNRNSTAHYQILAKSGSRMAQVWFHVNTCTDEVAPEYNLACWGPQKDDFISTIFGTEVTESLNSESFCTVYREPWGWALQDYKTKIDTQVKSHLQSLEMMESPESGAMEKFHSEFVRLDLLGDIATKAMEGRSSDTMVQDMVRQYEDEFGNLPDELSALINATK